jgi:hypothetical protein
MPCGNKVTEMKKNRRILTNRKAFSAVIASLILMLLAVAAGVVVYSYVMGWIGSATNNPTHNGQLSFDSIYANAGTPGTVKIYVRNVGGVGLMVSKIYINGIDMANATVIPDAGVALGVQGVTYLTVSYSMVANQYYTVQVTCKDGTIASQSFPAQ